MELKMISEMNLQDLENIKDCLLTDFDDFWIQYFKTRV